MTGRRRTVGISEKCRRFLTDRRDAPILVRIKTARSTTFAPSTTTPPQPTWSHAMRRLPICLLGALLVADPLDFIRNKDPLPPQSPLSVLDTKIV
jgi:hypothetical protein